MAGFRPKRKKTCYFTDHKVEKIDWTDVDLPRRHARICDFCILYGPKYRHFFLITQARYNVNSPRRGFLKRAKLSSKGKFLPRTYISLVMAASVVISYADSTPAAKRRWPVS